MARMMVPKNRNAIARTSIGILRPEYNALADEYNSIIEGEKLLCPKCGEWKKQTAFYMDSRFATNRFYMCIECVLETATDYNQKTKERTDNREKAMRMLQQLDLPFIESLYQGMLKKIDENTGERQRATAFQSMVTQLKSLPQYRGKTWKDSSYTSSDEDFEDEDDSVSKISPRMVKNGRKRFGAGYSDEEYQFLENEYQEWITRYECNTKAQEESFERLSMKKLEIHKATLEGSPTDKLDATYQQWLTTANITPKQSAANNVTDAQTFGTLIQKFEETRPLPEIDPELKDVDGIGLLIDVFFKGHLSKMFGLKNAFANIYEKYMKKYTVEPPKYEEEEDSESIFNRVFGNMDG